jgi:hypothetical protein
LKITALASTAVVGAALAARIAFAVPTHADPGTVTDDNFLAALKNAGITYHDPYQAVAAGQTICKLIDGGASSMDVVKDVQAFNPGFTLDGATKFAAIAANEYCPQYIQRAANS